MTYAKRVVEEAAKVVERPFSREVNAKAIDSVSQIANQVSSAIRAMPLPEPTQEEREGLAFVIASWDQKTTSPAVLIPHRELADAVLAWLREGGK